jgi:hypothetical protein
MILYYALGGGLGHISRSLAFITHAPKALLPRIRLLVSSISADVARPYSSCPMDRVPDWAMADPALYSRFLRDYFELHSFSCIILDTFPFGLLGELQRTMPDLRRLLIGRYIRWEAYLQRCAFLDNARWPHVAIMIEQQEEEYLCMLGRYGRIINAQWPISLARATDGGEPDVTPACCVVHSGPQSEIGRLLDLARRITAEKGIRGAPEIFRPEDGIFPMEHHLARFSDIVTGAGYAGCAASVVLQGRVRYHLHPFPRRFDDQALRLKRLQSSQWSYGGDASAAAALLWNEVT